MTLINSRDGKYGNSETVFSLAVSDTNEHDLPDVDGDDSDGGDGYNAVDARAIATKVVNNQDQDASARLEGATHEDGSFSEAVTVVSSVTVSSGGGVAVLSADPDVPLDWYRVVVSFDTAPSGGSETKVVYMES
jgi:hypothetical protein